MVVLPLPVGPVTRMMPSGRATISFISQTAEYTPPVIYSLEERQKLVYKIEARPAEPAQLRVGQPVTVRLP